MRSLLQLLLVCLSLLLVAVACVDALDQNLRGTVDVVVVDGTITNLAEPQIIRLNRSQVDRLTGRFGSLPLASAQVEVVVDSVQVVACHETVDGSYQLPSDFKGQPGHSYQLRFTLSDGTRYASVSEVMRLVPEISKLYTRFNTESLSPTQRLNGSYAAAHDFYVDVKDPADQHNYYRWDWIDWEQQEWCRSCMGGLYQVYNASGGLLEDCVPVNAAMLLVNDYNCRTTCWEIIYGNDLNIFDDQYSNGGIIQGRRVAQVPLYSKLHCLVEIRQSSLTYKAYTYFKQISDQTQQTGGITDTPPSAPIGNVHNQANPSEAVVGYFTASAVSSQRYWLTRQDATGIAPGLFQALNGRDPINELSTEQGRPPTATCVPSDSRTPYKPEGWRD